MNNTESSTTRPGMTPGASTNAKPSAGSPPDQLALLAEILALAQSGDQSGRLNELFTRFRKAQLTRLCKAMEDDQERTLLRLTENRRAWMDSLESVQRALARPDLTRAELLSLAKSWQQKNRMIENSLFAESELKKHRHKVWLHYPLWKAITQVDNS